MSVSSSTRTLLLRCTTTTSSRTTSSFAAGITTTPSTRREIHRHTRLSRPIHCRESPRCMNLHGRAFHTTPPVSVTKPFILADIGEGITECQLIQWFVQPGARVEHFDKICEVQSDKASVEITSPFDGVIKKLYYEPDDMAITGKPLVDIDIEGEISAEDEAKLGGESAGADAGEEKEKESERKEEEGVRESEVEAEGAFEEDVAMKTENAETKGRRSERDGQFRTLATPAVRHMTKEMKVDITEIQGTGRDGRVLKEDVQRHASQSKSTEASTSVPTAPTTTATREDRKVSLTAVQSQMFKVMTRSLNIPHFLYTLTADMTAITSLRKKLNAGASPESKVTHLAFIIKAVSIAFSHHPLLNSSLDTSDPKKPVLTYRGAHNFGVAIDAPAGLVVPVLKNVQDLSISQIASQLRHVSRKARDNKLSPSDFSGGTFTVSNIGSVGGGVVAPVISEPQVGILGIGRSKVVPAFDENEELIKKEELTLSWSADHRVVDGAECARCAERVRALLEEPASMMMEMR